MTFFYFFIFCFSISRGGGQAPRAPPGHAPVIKVDSCLVGHVFGQRGNKISRIIAQTTTRINNDYHQRGDPTFIIKGKAPNVASAVRQVKKAMEEGRTANLRSERQKEKEHYRKETTSSK